MAIPQGYKVRVITPMTIYFLKHYLWSTTEKLGCFTDDDLKYWLNEIGE